MKIHANRWESMKINESQCSPGLSPDFCKMISLKSRFYLEFSILFFIWIAIWIDFAPTGHLEIHEDQWKSMKSSEQLWKAMKALANNEKQWQLMIIIENWWRPMNINENQ
jgi:hypothetical protein